MARYEVHCGICDNVIAFGSDPDKDTTCWDCHKPNKVIELKD